MYEPVRVDINSKGKHRARKNNLVQPSQVNTKFSDFYYSLGTLTFLMPKANFEIHLNYIYRKKNDVIFDRYIKISATVMITYPNFILFGC